MDLYPDSFREIIIIDMKVRIWTRGLSPLSMSSSKGLKPLVYVLQQGA